MPWLWIPPMGKLEKKSVFSPHGRDETTTCRDRAKHFRKMGGQEKPRVKRERERERERELPFFKRVFSPLSRPSSTPRHHPSLCIRRRGIEKPSGCVRRRRLHPDETAFRTAPVRVQNGGTIRHIRAGAPHAAMRQRPHAATGGCRFPP